MDVSPRPHRWIPGSLIGGLRTNRHSAPVLNSSSSIGSIINNNNNSNSSSSSTPSSPVDGDSKKRSCNHCHLCGKRLLKLAKWRNYLTLPCRCRHVFCKTCITGRLQCRQRVLSWASFEEQWTFPCPASQQCGQQLNVDWSRGRRYSKNLVARDLVATSSDDSWEEEEEEHEDEMEVEGEECGGGVCCDEAHDVSPVVPACYVSPGCRHLQSAVVASTSPSSSRHEVRKSVSFDL